MAFFSIPYNSTNYAMFLNKAHECNLQIYPIFTNTKTVKLQTSNGAHYIGTENCMAAIQQMITAPPAPISYLKITVPMSDLNIRTHITTFFNSKYPHIKKILVYGEKYMVEYDDNIILGYNNVFKFLTNY